MKGANKKQNNFNIYNGALKKIKKNTCRYHYQNFDDIIYRSRDREQNIPKLAILGHLLPCHPSKNSKNQNFEKWKNLLKISSFYTCAPKITIIWCTVPEMQSETEKFSFCHFGPFFALLSPPLPPPSSPKQSQISEFWKKMKKMSGDIILLYIHVYHKWRSYDIWFLKYKVQQTEIFVILGHFLPFQPLDNLENQNFNIEKNTWRYYHFTHLHYKWQSYDVWFLRYGAQQTELFLSFWAAFCPFTPLWSQESKFLKNEKKIWRYYHFTNVYHKW